MNTDIATAPVVQTGALASLAASADTRKTLDCRTMLKGDSPKQAQAEAAKAYQTMLENPLIVATYGSDALSGLNDLIKRQFKEINAGKDPQVATMVKGLGKSLDQIAHKYNAADPKFIAKYENMHEGFLGIFGGIGAFWREFLRDARSIQSQIESYEQVIVKDMIDLQGIIALYQELYKQNDLELAKVIYAIATMEYIVDIATKDVTSIPVADDHDTTEERGVRGDLIKNLGNRISAYKTRLFLGWTKSPQLRSEISGNIGLYGTSSIVKEVAFPSMLEVFIGIDQLHKSQDIAERNNAYRATLNQALQQLAVNASIILPKIEKAVSMPILLAHSIGIMRDAYVAQTEATIKVLDEAAEQNAVLDDLYQSTATVFNSQSAKVTDAIIDQAIAATQKLEISTKTRDASTT
jgi:hypothetical protein